MRKSLCFIVLIGLVAGCANRLELGGAYAPASTNMVPVSITYSNGVSYTNYVPVLTATQAPDAAFYAVDAAYVTAYAMVDATFKWEKDNRLALWNLNPNIKHTLDQLRPQAVDVNQQFLKARAAYAELPVPTNLTIMQQVVAKMQQLLATASAVIQKP